MTTRLISYVNIDLSHQYCISVTEAQMSLLVRSEARWLFSQANMYQNVNSQQDWNLNSADLGAYKLKQLLTLLRPWETPIYG